MEPNITGNAEINVKAGTSIKVNESLIHQHVSERITAFLVGVERIKTLERKAGYEGEEWKGVITIQQSENNYPTPLEAVTFQRDHDESISSPIVPEKLTIFLNDLEVSLSVVTVKDGKEDCRRAASVLEFIREEAQEVEWSEDLSQMASYSMNIGFYTPRKFR